MTPLERFEEKYIGEPNSGCWLWLAQISTSGYGRFCVSAQQRMYAHHFSYETFKGSRNSLVVRHTCDVKCCVNPDHLVLGTHEDNYEDARQRKRYHSGERHRLSKLTLAQVEAIRCAEGPQTSIAATFEISQTQVSNIKTRKNWR